ncbi:MAG: cysteine desulfurase family protein, partial [bacterium]
ALLGADVDELVLTSGGTESNNTAIYGLWRKLAGNQSAREPGRVLSSPIEHPAVAEPLEAMHRKGQIQLEKLPVGRDGVCDAALFRQALETGPKPTFVTLMLANNETGAIQPVGEVAEICAGQGIAFHTDAVQAVGRIGVDFNKLGVTTLAAGSHKMHGPPGIGILLVRKGSLLEPLISGGGQQKGRRAGTPPVALAVGLAEALKLFEQEKGARHERWNHWRTLLLGELQLHLADSGTGIEINSPECADKRLPQTLNISFVHRLFVGELALMKLDLAGVAASLGSACASGSMRASPVLLAMGLSEERAKSAIRVSFPANATDGDIIKAARIMADIVMELTSGNE